MNPTKSLHNSSADIPDWRSGHTIIDEDSVKGGEAVHLPLTLAER
jgi:hypothetical protein